MKYEFLQSNMSATLLRVPIKTRPEHPIVAKDDWFIHIEHLNIQTHIDKD